MDGVDQNASRPSAQRLDSHRLNETGVMMRLRFFFFLFSRRPPETGTDSHRKAEWGSSCHRKPTLPDSQPLFPGAMGAAAACRHLRIASSPFLPAEPPPLNGYLGLESGCLLLPTRV